MFPHIKGRLYVIDAVVEAIIYDEASASMFRPKRSVDAEAAPDAEADLAADADVDAPKALLLQLLASDWVVVWSKPQHEPYHREPQHHLSFSNKKVVEV